MNMSELRDGWNRLTLIYGNMPIFRPEIGEEWLRVLGGFSAREFELALDRWIEKKKFRPVPAELAEYCFAARRQIGAERRRLQLDEETVCPWCGGSGWVTQMGRERGPGEYADVMFPCKCASSRNPEAGRRCLAAAEEDPGWAFDSHLHAFRRRTEWVGEEKSEPAEAGEIRELFAEAGRRIGATI